MDILIRVTADSDEYNDVTMSHRETTFQELLAEQYEHTLQTLGLIRFDTKKGITDRDAEFLRSKGWVHAETAKSREEKKTVEQEYWIVDETGSNIYYANPKFAKVHIDALTDFQIEQLSKGARLVQVVTPRSVLPSTQYKKLLTKKKQNEAKKEAAKKAVAKKAQKKKAKEVEAAKKLLAEAGEL